MTPGKNITYSPDRLQKHVNITLKLLDIFNPKQDHPLHGISINILKDSSPHIKHADQNLDLMPANCFVYLPF